VILLRDATLYRAWLGYATIYAVPVLLSVCPSVCLSVTFRYADHTGWTTSIIIITADQLKVCARAAPNIGDLVQREHPKNSDRIEGGVSFWAENLQHGYTAFLIIRLYFSTFSSMTCRPNVWKVW